jgi:hypothetical protein
MSGSTLAIIIIPVVVVIALATWIVMVYFAQRRPGNTRKVTPPDTAWRKVIAFGAAAACHLIYCSVPREPVP